MKKIFTALTLFLPIAAVLLLGTFVSAQEREILLAVSENADPAIKKAALTLVGSDVFSVLEASGGAVSAKPVAVNSEKLLPDAAFKQAAYNHLVIVGLPDQDPLLKKCRGNQIGLRSGEIEILGCGKWKGDFGTIECDRNPFLYSQKVKTNPYTTIIIKISGTSVAGVLKAIEAFQTGLLNGVVPAGRCELIETSILDRKPDDVKPVKLPEKINDFRRIGWTQPTEMEYRAYIDLAGFEPVRIWRIKYVKPKAFDDVSAEAWVNGLHRLAYGNAVTIAEFTLEEEAKKTWEALGKSNGAKQETVGQFKCCRFEQPTDEAFEKSFGDVRYFVSKKQLISVSLPEAEALQAVTAISAK